MTDSAAADMRHAERLTGQVLSASPRNPRGHLAKGLLLRAQNRFEEAIEEFERALESNNNWAGVIGLLDQCKLLIGSLSEAIPLLERAIRLSPAIYYSAPFIGELAWCICYNRKPMRRSFG